MPEFDGTMTARADRHGTGRAAPRRRLRMGTPARVAYATLFVALTGFAWLSLAGLVLLS